MARKKDDKEKYDEYDSPWKEAIEQYLPEFLALFFPDVAREITWEKGYEFLDKELQKVVREARSQERSVDKLVKVWRKSVDEQENKEAWVFIHIDVQSQYETDFARRLYIYNYRLFDRYFQPIATLVVLGDEKSWWHPKEYTHELWGCRLKLEFPTVKLLQYQQPERWAELEQSDNPFALVVMAHLYTKNTKHKPNERFEFKWRLTKMLYERGYSKLEILNLYRFINWMMALPKELEHKLDERIAEYEEEQKMPYITTMERRGMLKAARENIILVLQARFGDVSQTLVQQVNAIYEEAVLKVLLQHAATVSLLDGFTQKLAEVQSSPN